MAIKIKKNGVVQDLVINANEVRVLDTDGNFKSKNLESVLKEIKATGGTGTGGSGSMLKEAEYVFVGDTEPDYEGVWLDTSEDSTEVVEGDNAIVKAIRDYIDTDVKAIVDKNKELVQENNKIVNDIQTNVGNRLDVVPQLSNPNLLINSNFKNPINQRGQNSYSSNVYCVDRWFKWNNTFTTSIQNGFVRNEGIYIAFVQYIEDCEKIFTKGTTFTMSAKVRCDKEGREFSFTYYDHTLNQSIAGEKKILSAGTDWKVVSVTATVDVNTVNYNTSFCIESGADADTIIDIEWVKLELGSSATPFIPRPYGEELALCQRYYFRNRWKTLRTAVINSTSLRSTEYNYPVRMRVAPTINAIVEQPVNQLITYDLSTNHYPVPASNVSPAKILIFNNEMCDFQFTISGIEVKDYIIEIKDYAYEFDAEIY